jgi:hypothetical protein
MAFASNKNMRVIIALTSPGRAVDKVGRRRSASQHGVGSFDLTGLIFTAAQPA